MSEKIERPAGRSNRWTYIGLALAACLLIAVGMAIGRPAWVQKHWLADAHLTSNQQPVGDRSAALDAAEATKKLDATVSYMNGRDADGAALMYNVTPRMMVQEEIDPSAEQKQQSHDPYGYGGAPIDATWEKEQVLLGTDLRRNRLQARSELNKPLYPGRSGKKGEQTFYMSFPADGAKQVLKWIDGRAYELNDTMKRVADGKDVHGVWADFNGDGVVQQNEIQLRDAEGLGPGMGGDQYNRIVENRFLSVLDNPLSTFSIDVDTASYSNVRRFLREQGTLPPPDAVRIEELVNYFDYDYAGPEDNETPFAAHIEVTAAPWAATHRLVRVGLKGRVIPDEERPDTSLVFLIDVSGSMNSPDKLPLLVSGLKMLAEHVRDQDRVAIVVYAGSEGLALPSTPGKEREKIVAALDSLQAGGSTNGGAGVTLAYQIAQENFITGGVNRVMLCTDGDFNVGVTSSAELERLVEEKAKEGTFLTVLGFGRGNLNDDMMEKISNIGNGNYYYIDTQREAEKVLVEQMGGTLMTIAKDVKIQIEFNPAQVAAYRLIGYENRMLAAEDFNDDTKDAGEIGAGHAVTALYEIIPEGEDVAAALALPSIDPLKYQRPTELTEAAGGGEMLTLKLRYKEPDGDTSKLLEFPVADEDKPFGQASGETKFAAAVASFGMLLRDSAYRGDATYDAVLEIAGEGVGEDPQGRRTEFVDLVRLAKMNVERQAAEAEAAAKAAAAQQTPAEAAPAAPDSGAVDAPQAEPGAPPAADLPVVPAGDAGTPEIPLP